MKSTAAGLTGILRISKTMAWLMMDISVAWTVISLQPL